MSLDNLPEPWLTTKLVDVCEIILGQSPEGTSVNQDKRGIVFYQGKTEFGKLHPKPRNYCTAPKKIAEKNDILLSVRAPVGPTNIANETTAIGRGLAAIRAPLDMSFSYVLYYFKYLEPWLSQQGTGTTFKAISGEFIRNLDFIVPAEAEQQEIVRQLDVMLAQVEQIKARLDAIPAILKKFRQSVLADAVSGKLTEEWRLENINDDLNSELIQIKKNRESKVVGSQKRNLDFSVDENLKPDVDLPDSWKLVGLGDLIEFLTDYHANGSYEKLRDHVTLLDEENYACMIRATNFEKNNFDDLLIYIDQTAYEFLTKTKLFGNEILISKIGNAGSVYLMPKLNRPCSLAMNLFMLRFDEGLVNPRYINYFLTSIFGEKYISQYVRGVATKSIDKKSVRNVFVHYPCFNEQNQIVKVIDQLFEYVNRVEETVKSAQKRVNLLTQSILAKAFSGELTAEWREQHQDLITGVNSAESLLAKIQAEREASKPVKKTRAKKEA